MAWKAHVSQPCLGQQGPQIAADFSDRDIAADKEAAAKARAQSGSQASSSKSASKEARPNPADKILEGLTKEEIAKRTQLLLQIATSGLKVEEEMEKHASELDFACVRLMEKRIEAAHRAGESRTGLEGLVLLLNRIRLIAERNAATPAERLLDDLLRLLDASESAYDVNEVQEEIYYRLESALGAATVPGLAPGSSDIFSAAAVLSQGEALGEDEDEAGKDPDVEMVDRQDFIQLCEAMLDKAQRQLSQLQQAMQRGQVKADLGPKALQDRTTLVAQLQQVRQATRYVLNM
ncbi:g10379 [Coccomyxa viridis]|uniref:G10379 protein n=1 Tax=Coccomyxa viridis TaxID=1274662 RepID=A0ABP1G5J6_9CHLO